MSTVTTKRIPRGFHATATDGVETFTADGVTEAQVLESVRAKILERTSSLIFEKVMPPIEFEDRPTTTG